MNLPENRFKRRLAEGGTQYGIWCTIPDPSVVEALAGAGFDWMTLDTEHTPIEVNAVMPLLQAAAPYPTSCLVRASVNDTALIKRHLDQGAQTLLIPFVQTPEEAEAAVLAMHYAPKGVRGVAGSTRASRWGRVKDYARRAEAELCLIVQVETSGALTRLEEIAGVDGVDAVFIGPSDLAASMGYPGQAGHPDVQAAVLSAIGRLVAMGCPAGLMATDPAFARRAAEAGASFVAVAVDLSVLVGAADGIARSFGGGTAA
jgi:4-hydroxy-2-oxoheptanedioate aldolase